VGSNDKELFCIVKPEQLTLDNQDRITNKLAHVIKETMDFNDFKLAIITGDSRSYVSNYFRLQNYTRMLKDTNMLEED
jgi:hypothetical protein